MLKITIFRPFLHRTQRAHTAVRFVGPPLEQFNFPRRFFGAGK